MLTSWLATFTAALQIGATHRAPSVIARGTSAGSSTTRSSWSGCSSRPASVVVMTCPGSCRAPSRNT
ncbi:Uncharacterised protein [Mycobacteroides abscessus subsp. abscessus]|nr:Uncharacterised protein [Mycobacteroides abscessus subsp. abscessus]